MVQRLLLVWLVLTSVAFGSDVDERPNKHGIYRIFDPSEKYAGTAFVVKTTEQKTYLATAAHVVCADDAMSTIYSAGYEYPVKQNDKTPVGKVKVLLVAKDADIAIVEGGFTLDVEVLPIDPSPAPQPDRSYSPSGRSVSVLGYGGGKWQETKGFISFVSGKYLRADAIAIGGQSGGPVVSEGSVVGICSGGDAWYYEDQAKKERPFTWPLRAGSSSRLRELVDLLK